MVMGMQPRFLVKKKPWTNMVNHGLWSKQTNMEQHGQPCFWFKQTMD